jgi:hypothetical protein
MDRSGDLDDHCEAEGDDEGALEDEKAGDGK